MNKKNQGVKYDKKKVRMDLVPYDAVNEIAKVLTFGAEKYSERNWENGMNWSRAFGALQRHLTIWYQGQDRDKETSLSHLASAGCCLFFLIAWELRQIGIDDRPKLSEDVLENMDDVSFMENLVDVLSKYQKEIKDLKNDSKEESDESINVNVN